MLLANILPARPLASKEHADALLELAYLVTAVDGRLLDEELTAYREVAEKLRGAVSDAEFDALLDRFAGHVEPEEIADRVRELAPKVPAEHRELALKIAIGLAVADLDASPEESVLQELLVEGLGIADERAAEITDEVFGALGGGEG